MRNVLIPAITLALAGTAAVGDRHGDHPAVVAQRVHAAKTYDYAAKFYPHPAWLYLLREAPGPASAEAPQVDVSNASHETSETPVSRAVARRPAGDEPR